MASPSRKVASEMTTSSAKSKSQRENINAQRLTEDQVSSSRASEGTDNSPLDNENRNQEGAPVPPGPKRQQLEPNRGPGMTLDYDCAMDKSTNRGDLDVIQKGTPVPPGAKRPRLDPNRAPGMTLDHKDSFCGKLLHYMVGGSHPTNMSGTHVPGIRMDGATEGEYPKGMFSQNKRAVKAFVNCFAGYFHTMGGSIPPCPDCPSKSLHLNNNSNRTNPLKKTAYEYPWSIRAGFLPENIEAFELMEASTSKNGNKNSTKPKKSFGNNDLDSLPKPITAAAPAEKNDINDGGVGNVAGGVLFSNSNASVVNDTAPGNVNSAPTLKTRESMNPRSHADDSTSLRSRPNAARNAASTSSSSTSTTGEKKSLWREMQQRRDLEQEKERAKEREILEREWQQRLREENANENRRERRLMDNVYSATKLVDMYKDQIDAKLGRARFAMMSGNGDVQHLNLSRRSSAASTCRSISSVNRISKESSLQSINHAISCNKRKTGCTLTAASGML